MLLERVLKLGIQNNYTLQLVLLNKICIFWIVHGVLNNNVAKWDRAKPLCLQVVGSFVPAGGSVVFENGRKRNFLNSVQCGAAKRTPELLMPRHPCPGPSLCAHNPLAGGCCALALGTASLLQKRKISALQGSLKLAHKLCPKSDRLPTELCAKYLDGRYWI